METRVVHCKKEPFDVYIDRNTPFGNPYTHIANRHTKAHHIVKNRQESLVQFERYLRHRLLDDPAFLKIFLKLEGKTLGCWCKPKSCHGDIIVKVLNEYLTTRRWF